MVTVKVRVNDHQGCRIGPTNEKGESLADRIDQINSHPKQKVAGFASTDNNQARWEVGVVAATIALVIVDDVICRPNLDSPFEAVRR
jgi:hypothetical protein